MIGSPQNNFRTMQPPQTMPQPRNVMLSNALRQPQRNDQEENRPQEQYETSEQNEQYRQPQLAPSMMPANQYGQPTPQMSNWQMPQSNASYNLQPQIPGANQDGMGQGQPMNLGQTQGQNRFGVGLAKPMPQQYQVR
jgi:hypothetical protein